MQAPPWGFEPPAKETIGPDAKAAPRSRHVAPASSERTMVRSVAAKQVRLAAGLV